MKDIFLIFYFQESLRPFFSNNTKVSKNWQYLVFLKISVISWVLLAWISRYLDNLDSAISSLNIARIQEILCMIYVYIMIHIMHNISSIIAQDLGWISHYLGCRDI